MSPRVDRTAVMGAKAAMLSSKRTNPSTRCSTADISSYIEQRKAHTGAAIIDTVGTVLI